MQRTTKNESNARTLNTMAGLALTFAAAWTANASPTSSSNQMGNEPPAAEMADMDRSGQVSRRDVLTFVVMYREGFKNADLDKDGQISFNDVLMFSDAYTDATQSDVDASQDVGHEPIEERAARTVLSALRWEAQPADINTDGNVGRQDIVNFHQAYSAGTAAADITGEGTVNEADVQAFVTAFQQGSASSWGHNQPTDPASSSNSSSSGLGNDDPRDSEPTPPQSSGLGEDDPRDSEPTPPQSSGLGEDDPRDSEPTPPQTSGLGEDDPRDSEPTPPQTSGLGEDDPRDSEPTPLADFFDAIGKQLPAADYDQNGQIENADIHSFLEAWAKGEL